MSYTRFTQWTENGASLILDNPQNENEARKQVMQKFKLACNKLAELEDKIEQGTLIELPCKVGDTVYFIVHGCDSWMPSQDGGITLKQIVSVEEYTCMGFSIDEDYRISIVNEGCHEETFGVRAFLTRAEAEKGKDEYVKELEKELQK